MKRKPTMAQIEKMHVEFVALMNEAHHKKSPELREKANVLRQKLNDAMDSRLKAMKF